MTTKPQTKQALILERETRSSIELTRGAKGTYQWTVKIYFSEDESSIALVQLGYIDERLREVYLPAEQEPAE